MSQVTLSPPLIRSRILQFVALASVSVLLAACTAAPPDAKPAGPPAASQPAPAVSAKGQAEFDALVSSAKREGKVVLGGSPDPPLREAHTSFNKQYPDIVVEYIGGRGSVHGSRILAERDAGQYLLDVYPNASGSAFRTLKPKGVFDPLKPALVLPEVLDDSKWVRGFDYGFQDKERQFVYCFEATVKPAMWVNRDAVPESELSKLEQAADPKWKGKIAWEDPRAAGGGASDSAHMMTLKGKDLMTKLWTADPVISSDRRQMAEWLVRGTYPLAVGMSTSDFTPFHEQGLGKNIKGVEMDGAGARMFSGQGCVGLVNRAPHPNAAKVYVNWLLSKEAQSTWVQASRGNSRRTDVPGAAESAPGPNSVWTDDEPNDGAQTEATALAKQLIK